MEAVLTTGVTFQINKPKIYVPVVALSMNDNIEVLEYLKQAFKRASNCNKDRYETTAHAKSNNLNYMIDLRFRNINRLFYLSLKNFDDDPVRKLFRSKVKLYLQLCFFFVFSQIINF